MPIHFSVQPAHGLPTSLLEGAIERTATFREITATLREANPHLDAAIALKIAEDISTTLRRTPPSEDSIVISTSNATVLHGLHLARERSHTDVAPTHPERTAPPMSESERRSAETLTAPLSGSSRVPQKSRLPTLSIEVDSFLGPEGGEVVSLQLSRVPPEADFPEGWTCELEVDPPLGRNFRLADDAVFLIPREDTPRGTILQIGQGPLKPHRLSEILGPPERLPSTWRHHLVNLPHPSPTFSRVSVKLRILNEHSEEVSSQTERIPAPAWTMAHPLRPIKEAFAIGKITEVPPPPTKDGRPTGPPKAIHDQHCARYLADLKAALPVPLRVLFATTNDAWARDLAFTGNALTTRDGPTDQSELIQNPVERGTRGEAKVLAELQTHSENTQARLTPMTTPQPLTSDLNSGGNFICTPPLPHRPFGVIVTGVDPLRPVNPRILEFFEAQGKQPLFPIDTSWLQVGHADELLTFVPWPDSPKGFKVLLPDHSMALRLLEENSSAPMFEGVEESVEQRYYKLGRALGHGRFKASVVLAHGNVVGAEGEVSAHLNALKEKLIEGLGLNEADIVQLPVLFRKRSPHLDDILTLPGGGGELLGYQPFTPNPINMLVATRSPAHATLCIPKPFGPRPGEDPCVFEEAIRDALSPSGNKITFIDDYTTNHINGGNIHCSTNEHR